MDDARDEPRLLRMRTVDKRWAANTAPTIIVVDESASELEQAQTRLHSVGINARMIRRGSSALVELGKGGLDAALIAAHLTDISCVDWVSAAREATAIPILVGVRDEQLSQISSILMSGATAVIAYPFDAVEVADELEWAWETVRARDVSRGHLQVGPLELDAPSFSARLHERELKLTFGAFELLWCLMIRANRVVHPDEISRSLGRPQARSGSATLVKTQIARLRAELGDPSLIQTVRGQGYTLRHLLQDAAPDTDSQTATGP